jgi:hypothetical protein
VETLKHLAGDDVARPARNRGAKVDVPPFGMTGRDQELVPFCEEPLGKAFDAPVTVASFRPVEHGKNSRHRDSIDLLPFPDERRIVFRLELTQGVIVCESFRERDRDEVESGGR